jgi:hypothetical protein
MLTPLTGSIAHGVSRHVVSRSPSASHDDAPTAIDGGHTGTLAPSAPLSTESTQNCLAIKGSSGWVRQVLVEVVLEVGNPLGGHAVKGGHVETQEHLHDRRNPVNQMSPHLASISRTYLESSDGLSGSIRVRNPRRLPFIGTNIQSETVNSSALGSVDIVHPGAISEGVRVSDHVAIVEAGLRSIRGSDP